jgi:putative tricarboxylic transport membrane protein
VVEATTPATGERGGEHSSGGARRPRSWALLIRRVCMVGVLPGFAALYLWQATQIHLPRRTLVVSPRAFPIFVGVLMLLVAVVLAVKELRTPAPAPAPARPADPAPEPAGTDEESAPVTVTLEDMPDDEDEDDRMSSWRDAWIVLGSLLVYVIFFRGSGFVISTTIFLFGLSTYFAPKSWLRNAIVSIAFSVLAYYLFRSVLGVQLPGGILPWRP